MNRHTIALVLAAALLAVCAARAGEPARTPATDPRSTRDLLQDLDGWFVDHAKLRAELAKRDDLTATIAQLVRQRQATASMIWLLDEGPFERVEPILRQALESDDGLVSFMACLVLGCLGEPAGVALLEKDLARHANDRDALWTLEALADIEGPASDRALAKVLDHSEPIMRFTAAQTLARRGKTSVVPVLIELLDSPEAADTSCSSRPIYEEARRSLQELTYAYDMSPSSDPNWDPEAALRDGTAHHLPRDELTERGKFVVRAWKAAWQGWWKAHKHEDRARWRRRALDWCRASIREEKTRDAAVQRLLSVGTREAIDLLFAVLNDPTTPPEVQDAIADRMWFQENPLLEEPLRQALEHHPLAAVRGSAAYALHSFQSKASGAALVRALADEKILRHAIGSLSSYPYEEFLPALLPLTKHPNPEIRDSARRAIQAIKKEGSEAILLERLGTRPDAIETRLIVESLRWRGTERSLPELVALLRHGNHQVRAAAIRTIEGIAGVQFAAPGPDPADRPACAAVEGWWAERQRAGGERPPPRQR